MRREIVLDSYQGQSFVDGFKQIDKVYNMIKDTDGHITPIIVPENKSDTFNESIELGFSFTQTRNLRGVILNIWPKNAHEITLLIEGE